MSLYIIVLCMGIAALVFCPWLLALSWCFVILALGVIVYWLMPLNLRPIVMIILFLWLGFSWADYRAHRLLAWCIPTILINKPVIVVGTIVSIPKITPLSAHFIFKIRQFESLSSREGRPLNQALGHTQQAVRVRLSWYGHYPTLKTGQVWRLTVKLKPPHSFNNPGTFNYQRWLFSHGIRATGYVLANKPLRLLTQQAHYFFVSRFRQHLQTIIQHHVLHIPLAAIITTRTYALTAA